MAATRPAVSAVGPVTLRSDQSVAVSPYLHFPRVRFRSHLAAAVGGGCIHSSAVWHVAEGPWQEHLVGTLTPGARGAERPTVSRPAKASSSARSVMAGDCVHLP